MARPQLPASSRPTYFGGTPTNKQGYDRPDLTQDPVWQAENRPAPLDYSDAAIAERERLAREQAIENLQQARQLVSDAGPTGWVSPDAVPEPFQNSTPAALEQQAYVAYTMSLRDNKASTLLKYPTLAKAAIEAGVDAKDMARLVNYVEADAAAERMIASFALLYNEEGDPNKQRLGQYQIDNIMKSANPIMQAAIMDVVGEKLKELGMEGPAGADAASWADSFTQNAGKILDWVFTPLNEANAAVQRGVRAGMYGSQVEESQAFAPVGIFQNVVEYWDQVGAGQYNQQLLASAKQEFGALPVDLVLQVEQKKLQGDPDPLVSLFADNADNPEAMKVIGDMLYGGDGSGPDMMAVSRAVDNASLSNTGQLAVSSVLGDYGLGSEARDVAANVTNIAATIALDPTLLAGKVRTAYLATRYTIAKIAPTASRASIRAAFQMAPVRRYYDSLFKNLNRYETVLERDPAAASVLREQIRRQFPETPDDVIDTFFKDGIRDIEALTDWTVETNATFLMMKGKNASAVIGAGEDAAVEPLSVAMSRGQAVTREALLPRRSATYVGIGKARFAQMIGSKVMPRGRAQAIVEDVYSNTSDPAAFTATIEDVANVQRAGSMERAGMVNGVPGSFGKRVDSVFKYFGSIGLGHVNIVDGRDAKLVYRYARSFLSRRHATYWADMWRRATPSQRYDMMIGLNRTAAAAKGLDLSNPEILSRVDELITATSKTTSFSAKSLPLSKIGVLPDVEASAAAAKAAGGANAAVDVAQTAVDEMTIPSLFPDGSEKALFGWQTASHVALPNIREMEKLGRWQRFVEEHGGDWGSAILNAPQRITDAWSLGTLFGLRFSLRSAIEDWWFYSVITGGNLKDLYKGRRMSTMLREARGRVRTTAWKGQKQLALGMFNRRLRRVGDQIENRENAAARILGRFIVGNLDQSEVNAAHAAALKGDFDPMRRLAATAMARSKFTFLSDAEKGYFLDLVDGPFGLKIMDELAETGSTLGSGGLVDEAAFVAGADAAGVSVGGLPRTGEAKLVPVGDYTPELPVETAVPGALLAWERHINGVALNDGPAGKIALAYIDDPEEAVRRVAQEIRDDPTGYGYKWRFAALQNESPESFAQRKVQAVRALFSDANGNLNESLWRRLVDENRNVSAFTIAEDGTKSWSVDYGVLKNVPREQRPAYVSGQLYGTAPMPDGLGAFFDRSWTWMGEQYARISREPIFLANYLAHRKQLAEFQGDLAAEIGDKAARRVVSRMAEDRAYAFTLAYMDNPQNRSLLAYKVRNFARYYRATEDFYRRMMRAGKNYPVGLWKTALIYDVLDDTGFVYTDENGNKYFLYPGTNELMSAMNWAVSKVAGQDMLPMEFPFVLGGQVKMLAPSTDPNQMVATVSGPIGSIGWKLIARRFPTLQKFDRAVLGEYSQSGEGSVVDDFYSAFVPGGLQKALNSLNDDELASMQAAAAKDALVIGVVNGIIPEDENSPQFTDAMAKLDLIATSAVAVRFLMGLIVPASPQKFNENVTEYARLNGVSGLRPAFLSLVRKHSDAGEENPVGMAMAEWWKLNPNLAPYTVSKSQPATGGVRSLAPLQTSRPVLDWYRDNRDGIIAKYPQTAYFLAPQDEGFDWNTWGLIMGQGLRVPKGITNADGTPGAFLRDLFAAQDEFKYYATIRDYQQDIDKLDPRVPEQYTEINKLKESMRADLNWIRDRNPYLDQKLAQSSDWDARKVFAQRALTQTKLMVDEMFASTPTSEWNGSAAQAIRNAIYTYMDYANEIRISAGSDTASELKRRNLRIDLERDLNVLADENPNAKLFIQNVLMADPDVKVLDLELVGATSG